MKEALVFGLVMAAFFLYARYEREKWRKELRRRKLRKFLRSSAKIRLLGERLGHLALAFGPLAPVLAKAVRAFQDFEESMRRSEVVRYMIESRIEAQVRDQKIEPGKIGGS